MEIADRLKTIRRKLGLSQSEAAKTWGINIRTLQTWEQGRRRPRGLALIHLEGILEGALRGETAQPARKRTRKHRA